MAWRPHEQLIEGELDNTVPGKVTGWMRFRGLKGRVTFDLNGNFHRDIRGAKVRIEGPGKDWHEATEDSAREYMRGFARKQTGNVGDMTLGGPPTDYVDYPYIEWYGDRNGRCVLELGKENVEVLTPPIPAIESDPIDRGEQEQLMSNFMQGLVDTLNDQAIKAQQKKQKKEQNG
jgi:hypothetical protein